MSFEITVTETNHGVEAVDGKIHDERIERFRQCVDSLNLPELIAVINKPRRQRKPRSAKLKVA